MMDDHRLNDSKQPKDLISQLNKLKVQGRENKEVVLDDDWEDYSDEDVDETNHQRESLQIKEKANYNQGKYDSLKAIVNNNERQYGQRKYKNNKQFKPKKEGSYYPKNNYEKKQYFNNNENSENLSKNQFNNNNNFKGNNFKNNYNSYSKFSSKPTFSNPNADSFNKTIPIQTLEPKQSIPDPQPPSFINSNLQSSNPKILSTISDIEQIATLDISNVNPNFSNTNPNYQKNNNGSTFVKKKYEFSDDKPLRKDLKGSNTNITRNFENKQLYLTPKFREDKETVFQKINNLAEIVKNVTEENSQIHGVEKNYINDVNKAPKLKPDKLFEVKPTFFNPCKETNEPCFKQLETNGDLYTLNLKMKGYLEEERVKNSEQQEKVKKPLVESNEDMNKEVKSPQFKKEKEYNSNYQSNYHNDKYYYHNKNNNYYDNKKGVSNGFNPEIHPNYTTGKKNFKQYGNSDDIWNQFNHEDDVLDIEEEEIEQYNRGYHENDNFKNNYGNRNEYKKQPYKKYNNDYRNKDYSYNSYNPNNITVEKTNSGKPEVKKVILLKKDGYFKESIK